MLITIKQGRKIKKKITIAVAPVNVARSYSFKVKLKKGTYKWTVSAVDAAGNKQIEDLDEEAHRQVGGERRPTQP